MALLPPAPKAVSSARASPARPPPPLPGPRAGSIASARRVAFLAGGGELSAPRSRACRDRGPCGRSTPPRSAQSGQLPQNRQVHRVHLAFLGRLDDHRDPSQSRIAQQAPEGGLADDALTD